MTLDRSEEFTGFGIPWLVGAAVLALILGLALGMMLAPAPTGDGPQKKETAAQEYTCSMHPQIRSKDPKAKCPICFMDLVPLEAGGADEGPRQLVLSDTAKALAELVTAPVRHGHATRTLRLVGTLAFDETRVRHVTAWVGGRLDHLFVDSTGIPVQTGEHMAELYSPALISAHQELLQAKSRPELLSAARERLLRWGILPEQLTALEAAKEPTQNLTIHAPVSGVVVQKLVNEGMYVEQGKPLFAIADLSRLWLVISAYESDVQWLRYGQTVRFSVNSLPGETFSGRVSFIDPILNDRSRTVSVRVNVDNAAGRLKPGMFSRVVLQVPVNRYGKPMTPHLVGKWICPMHPEIIKDGQGPCDICGMDLVPVILSESDADESEPLLIPDSAPLWTGIRSVAYRAVPGKPSTYEGVVVELGPHVDGFYILHGGLVEGDEVVLNGAFKLDAELQIRARLSMMAAEGTSGPISHRQPPKGEALTAQQRESYAKLVKATLQISKALAADDLAAVKSAAADGTAAVAAIPDHDGGKNWPDSVHKFSGAFDLIGKAKDLSAGRVALRELTGILDEALPRFGQPLPSAIAEMHCPMAFDNQGASWYQEAGELANPYFGAAMLRCGSQRAELPAAK